MSLDSYYAPIGRGESQLTEKRSRFLGFCLPASSEDEAKAQIAETRAKFSDARHVVWAYILPDGTSRASDDGEPQGTAGAPLSEQLRRAELRGAIVLVVRYFGGILLGPGGLRRAYSEAAASAVEDAPKQTVRQMAQYSVSVPYSAQALIKNAVLSHGGTVSACDYGENVKIAALFSEENPEGFLAAVRDATNGASEAVFCGISAVSEA
ncbi:MAG: YigZ family protein [Oscillospiraceae bacterium]|jgi:uncharacterized YigZ family protein|nr:YigZ family protein [Oscillospiraceae bacterium]